MMPSPSEFQMMPWGIIWSPPDIPNGNDYTASSNPKPPHMVPFYTFNDGFDVAIFIFLLNSIVIFVKLIQEYRGGA